MKLDIKGVALAAAVVTAGVAFVMHGIALQTGAGSEFIAMVLPYHPGATFTVMGGIVHAVWMFIYGAIGGAAFAWVYNHAARS